MKRCRCGEKGFTLIEAVLTILVFGIMATVVGIGMNNLGTVRLNNAVGKVVADLRYAQQLSATTRSRHGMAIDSAQQYTIHIDNAGLDTPIQDPTNLGQSFVVNFLTYQQGRLNGVTFNSTNPFCLAPGCAVCGSVIEFDGLGTPTDTSGAPLCNVTLTLAQSGAPNQTITIAANTGKITY